VTQLRQIMLEGLRRHFAHFRTRRRFTVVSAVYSQDPFVAAIHTYCRRPHCSSYDILERVAERQARVPAMDP